VIAFVNLVTSAIERAPADQTSELSVVEGDADARFGEADDAAVVGVTHSVAGQLGLAGGAEDVALGSGSKAGLEVEVLTEQSMSDICWCERGAVDDLLAPAVHLESGEVKWR
jgi:hypothetical protein